MNLLTAMTTFVRVVETGSFTAVAREQGSLQPAISKQIAWLEGHLGNRLIERTTRRLLFTDQALTYYEQCKVILDAVSDAEKAVRADQTQISGSIRIASSVGFGSFQIAPSLPVFLEKYPRMSVDLRLSDTYVDVVAEGIDLAFRIGQAGDATVISRRIGLIRPILVASKNYCDKHGRPANLKDLSAHKCIVISGRQNTAQWRFEGPDADTLIPNGPLQTDSGVGARALVLAHAGIALLPSWLFATDTKTGTVEQLLPKVQAYPIALHAITPLSRRHSTKVKAFLDFLTDILVRGGAIDA
jgi:DNA-binding transcriptional LysR family regulator